MAMEAKYPPLDDVEGLAKWPEERVRKLLRENITEEDRAWAAHLAERMIGNQHENGLFGYADAGYPNLSSARYAHLSPQFRHEAVEKLCEVSEEFGEEEAPGHILDTRGGKRAKGALRRAANDGTSKGCGTPDRIRTCDLRFRNSIRGFWSGLVKKRHNGVRGYAKGPLTPFSYCRFGSARVAIRCVCA